MNPQDANQEYIRGNVELVRIRDAEGRIAAEGALPYPPGVLCVVPGKSGVEQYSATSRRWKRALICCRVSRQSCRAFTARRMPTGSSDCMGTC